MTGSSEYPDYVAANVLKWTQMNAEYTGASARDA
jgi:hypothetical protein